MQLLDRVVQALQVLHVQRADHVDPCREDLLHVLVTLGVSAVGRVGVGQLVHQGHLRLAREDGVDVHLLDGDAAVFHLPARD